MITEPVLESETKTLCKNVDVYIKLGPNGRKPLYASLQAAGCDLFAARDLFIRPGETLIMPLDMVIALPEGTEAQIRPRSGLSLRTDLRVANAPGTIDADYRNEVSVILQNTFNPSLLPQMMLTDESLMTKLNNYYRAVRLIDYLTEIAPMETPKNHHDEEAVNSFLQSVLFLDENDNPYGTIYLKKDDRVAQMVLMQHLKANFIEHEQVREIGLDRGGGFGSTGV